MKVFIWIFVVLCVVVISNLITNKLTIKGRVPEQLLRRDIDTDFITISKNIEFCFVGKEADSHRKIVTLVDVNGKSCKIWVDEHGRVKSISS